MNRRKFLRTGAAGVAGAGLLSQMPFDAFSRGFFKAVNIPIGYQSYVLRKELNDDFVGVLKQTAGYGFDIIEMCSPAGYAPYSFANLTKYSGKELKTIINDAGLKCVSSHFTWDELNTKLDDRIAFAHDMGLKNMIASGGLHGKTVDELKAKCDTLNAIGEKIKKAGLVAGYHNHTGEFQEKKDGRPDYDIICDGLNPDVVKMQFQVAAIQAGYKAADYFRKFPGRFLSAHLQDFVKGDMNKQIALGQGIVDWKEFFEAGKIGGIQAVYVENESEPGSLEPSVKYLRSL